MFLQLHEKRIAYAKGRCLATSHISLMANLKLFLKRWQYWKYNPSQSSEVDFLTWTALAATFWRAR